MVLRKPYAFLIRNFKKIHILLTILMILFFFKMKSIGDFLTSYIAKNSFRQEPDVVSQYIGTWGFLLPIIIIAILVVIVSLLREKKKPVRYYLFTILVYVIELIMIILAFSNLSSIEQDTVNIPLIEIFRDAYVFIIYLPIPSIIISLVRSVGFNIKQFNFKKDLMELNISDEDNAEFEVDLEVDTEDLKSKFNKQLRMIKYVYIENKKLVWGIIACLIFVLALWGFNWYKGLDRTYSEGKNLKLFGMDVKVIESYQTNKTNNGKIVNKNRSYVIVRVYISNNTKNDKRLDFDHLYLRTGKYDKYSPITNRLDEFAEFGYRLKKEDIIKAKTSSIFSLVYELPNDLESVPKKLEMYNGSNYKDGELFHKYVKYNLKPQDLTKVETLGEFKLGDNLDFGKSLIAGTNIKIEEASLSDKYQYKYYKTIGGIKREYTRTVKPSDSAKYDKQVMKLKLDLKQNESVYNLIYNNFYEKFVFMEYELNGEKVRSKINSIDLTPSDAEDTYLEVEKVPEEAEKVYLIFRVRNKEYRYLVIDRTVENEDNGEVESDDNTQENPSL